MTDTPSKVFVSYAHEDRKWADELATYLTPGIRDRRLSLWDDRQIEVGSDWFAAIQDALSEATVSILLVTQAFLASSFIAGSELPTILERVDHNQTRLFWIAVKHSTVEQTPLVNYQAANDPSKPLASLSASDRAAAWVDIALRISDASTLGSFANTFAIVDDTTEAFEALVQGREEDQSREHRVVARYEPSNDQIAFTGVGETITYEDVSLLPADDREFILDLEDSLTTHYSRYRVVKKRVGAVGGALDAEAEDELKRIGKLMCRDLVSILDFLRQIYKVELEDHYGRYRYICSQLS